MRRLIALPFIALMRGDLKAYHPLVLAAPTMSIFYCVNIFTKLAVGALSGFEYVAILAGETRSPARDIGRSVIIASPVIALAFILGTSSVLAFIGDKPIDLIGPVPQTLRLGLRFFPIASRNRVHRHYFDDRANDRVHERARHRQLTIADGRRLGRICCRAGSRVCIRSSKRRSTRSFLSARLRSPLPSPARSARAFRKHFNWSITPRTFSTASFISRCSRFRSSARLRFGRALQSGCASLRSAALLVSLSAIFFTIYPIIDVPSPLSFAVKIVAVTAIANAIGVAIYLAGKKRQRA